MLAERLMVSAGLPHSCEKLKSLNLPDAYRADGMRVSKANGANGTTYRYDGQMAMEDVDTGSNPAVTDYAIGARGIDAISKTVGSNTTVVYPIYDAHGNMMADVSRSGSSFSINDKRSYDAWGNIRSGASTGDPKGRYCANLGHVVDDESNLIYMRARYYDPTSGRFLSEDPDMNGTNWYAYAEDSPLNLADETGEDAISEDLAEVYLAAGFALVVAAFLCSSVTKKSSGVLPRVGKLSVAAALLAGAVLSFSFAIDGSSMSPIVYMKAFMQVTELVNAVIIIAAGFVAAKANGWATAAVLATSVYGLECLAVIADIDGVGDGGQGG